MLIRDALRPYPAGLVIATKGGFIRGGPDYADFGAVGNREYLRQRAFLSARRLGVERLDLYYLHSPNATNVPSEDQVGTLAELREQGVIRRIACPTSASRSAGLPGRSPRWRPSRPLSVRLPRRIGGNARLAIG